MVIDIGAPPNVLFHKTLRRIRYKGVRAKREIKSRKKIAHYNT